MRISSRSAHLCCGCVLAATLLIAPAGRAHIAASTPEPQLALVSAIVNPLAHPFLQGGLKVNAPIALSPTGQSMAAAALTSPTPGSVLSGPKVTFTWSAAAGATGYNLRLGTTPGANNLFGSGLITATSVTAVNLPTDSSTIYAQLITNYGATQVSVSYSFRASPACAALASPQAGSVLAGPQVTFNWTAAAGATGYNLRLGTTPGANNLFGSGLITTTSIGAVNLPTDGSTVYARLVTSHGAIQSYIDYTFKGATRAALTSPAAGSVLAGPAMTFTWTTAAGATGYNLRLGTTPGANNLFGLGPMTATSAKALSLPTDGSTVYAQLITDYGAIQASTNYTFRAAPVNPAPVIRNLSPGFVRAGSVAQNLTVIGTGFIPATTITYAGASHPVKYVNSTMVVIPLTASDQATMGIRQITLTNPLPVGGSASTNLPVLMVTGNMLIRSQLAAGDQSRMQRLVQKGRNGQPVTMVAIGGSITIGAKASDWAHIYQYVLGTWWQIAFPSSAATVINAGVGASQSDYGALRASRDVLAYNPDLVIVEFAVNDRGGGAEKYGDTYEGLVRQLLDAPSHPAVILLFMSSYFAPVDDWKNTAQQWQSAIGTNYDAPMVSYHDAIVPELLNGAIPLDQITPDGTHPNDLGHAYAALFLKTALQNAMDTFPPGSSPLPIPPTAPPLHSDHFEFTTLRDGIGNHGPALNPTANNGWTAEAKFSNPDLGSVPEGLESSTPGSTLDFTVNGTDILIGFWMIDGPMGEVRATVDGTPYPTVLEGWVDATWGGYRGEARVASGLAPGNHQVHLELLSSQHPGSTGTTFRLLSVGTGGTQASPAHIQ